VPPERQPNAMRECPQCLRPGAAKAVSQRFRESPPRGPPDSLETLNFARMS